MRKLLIAALIVVGVSTPSHADFKDALDAYKQGAHGDALKKFMPMAKLGDPRSRLMLGVMHGEGKGVKRSDFMAHVWFILAARSARYGKLHELAEKYRSVFAEDLSTSEMIEAGRMARELSIQWRRELFRWNRAVGRKSL